MSLAEEEEIDFTSGPTTGGGTPDTGSGPAGTTTTTPRMAFKPNAPKRGGLMQVGTDQWAPWTGGKPKVDWSGLEVPNPSSIEPNQYRSVSIGAAAKGQYYRTQGLTTKFSRTKDLMDFQQKMLDHFVEHGMDTITYLPDPGQKNQLVSIMSDHGKFNLKEGVEAANDVAKKHFDAYDQANQKDARKVLLNSCEPELEKELRESCG